MHEINFDPFELPNSGTPINVAEEVRRGIILAEDKWRYSGQYLREVLGYSQQEIDSAEACEPSWHREARDWSELRNKVFGAEGDSCRKH